MGAFAGESSSASPFSTPTFILANAGMYFAIGSPSEMRPSSTSIMAATVVTGLLIE